MTQATAKPDTTKDSASVPGELFPIRTVSSLTGVNAITLRAWERRYGLVVPVRTPTGHRLYRREDIELIHQALGLMEKGISISQVKKSLQRPARFESASNSERSSEQEARTHSLWAQFQSRMLTAITRFDEDAVESAYNAALALYPVEQVTMELLLPLLQELGRRWETAEGSIAEEHFFGVYLRNKLGARFHHRQRNQHHKNGESGPRILAACLPGEQHEIGLLIFALTAHDHGLHPVLLGANTPLSELPAAVKRARCAAIVLSGSIMPAREVINVELRALTAAVRVPVFVGGMTSVRSRDSIVAAGAVPLGTELSLGAERIRSALAAAPSNT